MKRNDELPFYFDQDEVLRIFEACHNLKHLAMLQTLFYGCLRASELCNLDDRDLDLKSLTIHVREGKGGKDGMVYISEECARTLKQYLKLDRNGRSTTTILFSTPTSARDGIGVMSAGCFIATRRKPGSRKLAESHVFARHTAASILVANGCDLRHVKELLRHKDIRTTLRYAHVGEKTLREKYDRCLTLGVRVDPSSSKPFFGYRSHAPSFESRLSSL